MLEYTDFSKKQIIFYTPAHGDKLSYQNDNIVIKDGAGCVKYKHTCYRVFMLVVVGDVSITTGLIRRAKKFGFSICFMTLNYKIYSILSANMEGNTLLHKKQYDYSGNDIAQYIIRNKIINQRAALNKIRNKTQDVKDGIKLLDSYISRLLQANLDRDSIMGIEGNAAKVYFPRIFNQTAWIGRKPRIKYDYINSLLDIGYNLLFNFVDAILQVFGFDEYYGVLHTCFYMRKSLVCDLMEPFRPIIDWKIRTGINLGQFCKEDFVEIKGQWQLDYKKTTSYVSLLAEELIENKECIFLFVREYYRAFMKGKNVNQYKMYLFETNEVKIKDIVLNDNEVGMV